MLANFVQNAPEAYSQAKSASASAGAAARTEHGYREIWVLHEMQVTEEVLQPVIQSNVSCVREHSASNGTKHEIYETKPVD